MKTCVLIVDDEPAQRQLLIASLDKEYQVVAAANGREATQLLSARSFDLIVTDERMPDMSGIELIRWVHERIPEIPVIVLTAYGSIATAVEAMKLGAQEYLTKPLKSPEELRLVVARTLKRRALRDQSLVLQAETENQHPADIVAASAAMKRVLTLAMQVAPQSTTVLLTGESGTGKEVIARYIHRGSPRAGEPFVAVNCAALAETLLESELFGHEKGAFTGAVQARRGRFELAHGGTLFLDEVGEMGVNLQAKLLRVLQEQQFERLGSTRTIMVDVRVIAATNKDLSRAMEERSFRADLYYRLNVFPISIPPLRERREDILPLAEHMTRKIAIRLRRRFEALHPEVQRRLHAYPWPGNVRELQNVMERAIIFSIGTRLDLNRAMPQAPTAPAQPPPVVNKAASDPHILSSQEIESLERANIERALAACSGKIAGKNGAAARLGLAPSTLNSRLKALGIQRQS